MKFSTDELARMIVVLQDEWAACRSREHDAMKRGDTVTAAHWKKRGDEWADILARLDDEKTLLTKTTTTP